MKTTCSWFSSPCFLGHYPRSVDPICLEVLQALAEKCGDLDDLADLTRPGRSGNGEIGNGESAMD